MKLKLLDCSHCTHFLLFTFQFILSFPWYLFTGNCAYDCTVYSEHACTAIVQLMCNAQSNCTVDSTLQCTQLYSVINCTVYSTVQFRQLYSKPDCTVHTYVQCTQLYSWHSCSAVLDCTVDTTVQLYLTAQLTQLYNCTWLYSWHNCTYVLDCTVDTTVQLY